MSAASVTNPFGRATNGWTALEITVDETGPRLDGRAPDGTADPSTLGPVWAADQVAITGLAKNTQTAGAFWRGWWALDDVPTIGGLWSLLGQVRATPSTVGAIWGLGFYNGTNPTSAQGIWAAVWGDTASEKVYLQANNVTGYSASAAGGRKVALQLLGYPVPPSNLAIRSHAASVFDDGGNVLQGEERAVTVDWANGDTVYAHLFLGAKSALGDVTLTGWGGVVGYTNTGLGE